ncbi:VOC family protein, partial [Singulisphaera rosea]
MSNAIPEGFHSVTPHLIVKGAAEAIEFYKRAFGAEEICRIPGPDGSKLIHAAIQVGTSRVFLVDDFPEFGSNAPQNGTPVTLHLYVEDADAAFERAIEAGATAT